MRKRLLFSAAVFVALIGMGVLVLVMLRRGGVTEANISRIRNGMTKEQVEQVLGEAPTNDREFVRLYREWAGWPDGELWEHANGGYVFVIFQNGVVHRTQSLREQSFAEKIRHWLGWQKEVARPDKTACPTPPVFPTDSATP